MVQAHGERSNLLLPHLRLINLVSLSVTATETSSLFYLTNLNCTLYVRLSSPLNDLLLCNLTHTLVPGLSKVVILTLYKDYYYCFCRIL